MGLFVEVIWVIYFYFMINVILIDDEPRANALLKLLLENHYSNIITVVDTAQSIKEACSIILENTIDLVFLDIQMPEENGFALFNYFPNPTFDVIFTTAYDRYAIQAFQYSAFDYLLKPIDEDVLGQTIHRYLSKKTHFRMQKEQIALLKSFVDQAEEETKKIYFNTLSGFELTVVNAILYIKAAGNYSEVFIKNDKRIVVSQSLGAIEDRLPPSLFFRTHKSYLVSLAAVVSFDKKEKTATLIDGSTIEVSYRRENEFLERILEEV